MLYIPDIRLLKESLESLELWQTLACSVPPVFVRVIIQANIQQSYYLIFVTLRFGRL